MNFSQVAPEQIFLSTLRDDEDAASNIPRSPKVQSKQDPRTWRLDLEEFVQKRLGKVPRGFQLRWHSNASEVHRNWSFRGRRGDLDLRGWAEGGIS